MGPTILQLISSIKNNQDGRCLLKALEIINWSSENRSHKNISAESSEINRVAVKLPPFWRNKPNLWFFQLEAQFDVANITQDQTKYNIVLSALDEHILDFIEDILSNPPTENKNIALKSALLSRLTDSEEAKLKKLLGDLQLGACHPSDLMRQMKNLAGSKISELLKTLWDKRLQQQVQAFLSVSKATLTNLAEMADKIMSVYNPTDILSVNKQDQSHAISCPCEDNSHLSSIEASIESLAQQTHKLHSPNYNKPRYRDFLYDSKLASPSSFVQQLRNTLADLRPVLPSHHTKQKPFIFWDLATCTHVFVHTDSVRTSLQPPYEGPYPVIKRYAKYFDISIKGVSRTISIDRLKPCFFTDPDPYKPTLVDKFLTTSTSPSTVLATPHHSQQSTSKQYSKLRVRFAEPPAQYVTRSGRAVHPSKRFL
ncbi:uncharacterized protein TNCT_222271 [Trichonephila clavata]|uniref:DUF7041 domain-containing protein n=1 Tax=Trichonephila clavata TaxID=2740835 RepID=A0A8X6LFG6_TRICU|nr:uncharacterized protein TNCT_222271 [Trichonephila clavata]